MPSTIAVRVSRNEKKKAMWHFHRVMELVVVDALVAKAIRVGWGQISHRRWATTMTGKENEIHFQESNLHRCICWEEDNRYESEWISLRISPHQPRRRRSWDGLTCHTFVVQHHSYIHFTHVSSIFHISTLRWRWVGGRGMVDVVVIVVDVYQAHVLATIQHWSRHDCSKVQAYRREHR